MFKKILFIVALTAIISHASWIRLADIEAEYYDTHGEMGILTDTDGANDDATCFLFLELAGYKNINEFGIYEFTENNDGTISVGDMLEVFFGADDAVTSSTLKFDLAAGTVENNVGTIKDIDKTFGFYIKTIHNKGNDGIVPITYYSHTILNEDGFDHFKTYNTSDNSIPKLLGSDVVLAIEDLYGGGDKDFEDMIIGMSDVQIPEPGIISLIGFSIICFAGYRSRRR